MTTASLILTMNTQPLVRGAQTASQALGRVQTSATGVGRGMGQAQIAIDQSARSMQAFGTAAAAVSGVLGAGGSFAQFGVALGQIGTNGQAASTAMFALGRGVLEVSRVASDFRAFRQSLDGTLTVSQSLAALWRAHPLLVIAGLLSTVGAAMSLFASSTGNAADETERLANAQSDLSRVGGAITSRAAERRALSATGFETTRTTAQELNELRNAVQAAGRDANLGRPITIADGATILGLPPLEFAKLYAKDVVTNITDEVQRLFGGLPPFALQAAFQADLPGSQITSEQFNRAAFDRRQTLQSQLAQETPLIVSPPSQLPDLTNTKEELIEINRLAADVGFTLADGFFRAATGAASFREALGGILQDLTRIATNVASSGFASFIGGSFGTSALDRIPAGSTITQAP